MMCVYICVCVTWLKFRKPTLVVKCGELSEDRLLSFALPIGKSSSARHDRLDQLFDFNTNTLHNSSVSSVARMSKVEGFLTMESKNVQEPLNVRDRVASQRSDLKFFPQCLL